MDWYAPIARHIMIPLQARRNGTRWPWHVSGIAAWEYLSPEEIARRQWRKMEALLAHAYENVPYYRRVFSQRDLRPSDISNPEALRHLPVLTKQDVREHYDHLVAQNIPAEQLVESFTGGTTGLPMRFKRDIHCRDLHYASHAAFARWYGHHLGERQALIWGAPQDLLGPLSLRQRTVGRLTRRPEILDCRDLSEAKMDRFARFLQRWKPRLLKGYAHAVEHFASHAESRGIRLSIPAVVCTAEPLYEHQRNTIETALRAEVFDEYAGREFGLMAAECDHHRGLHVNAASLFLEVLMDEKAAPPATPGRLVGTDLDGFGMPLIRYDLGDLGSWADEPCPCGRGLPLLSSIDGRSLDMLIGPTGRRASSGIVVYTMGKLDIPAQLQFMQAEDTSIEVRAVPEPGFGVQHEENIREALTALLGEGLRVEIRRISQIPRTPSGKYIYAQSAAAKLLSVAGQASPTVR